MRLFVDEIYQMHINNIFAPLMLVMCIATEYTNMNKKIETLWHHAL